MAKYLAIYNGVATDEQKQELSPADQEGFMNAWAQWAEQNRSALVDPGAPLFRKWSVTSSAVTQFEDTKTGYAIVEAASHKDATDIFSSHPHLTLASGNFIEVIECPSAPTS